MKAEGRAGLGCRGRSKTPPGRRRKWHQCPCTSQNCSTAYNWAGRRSRCEQEHRWSSSNHMVGAVACSPVIRQLILQRSLFQYNHTGIPYAHFDGKDARRRQHEYLAFHHYPISVRKSSEARSPYQRHSALLSKGQQCYYRPLCYGVGILLMLSVEWIWGWMQRNPGG
jgi:hypothetical protein